MTAKSSTSAAIAYCARLEDDALWLRRPFAPWWIVNRLLAAGALQTMNDEERAVVIVMINTGARPSEIINLRRRHIVLDATPVYPRAARRSRPENSDFPPRHPTDQNLARGDAAFPDGFPHHRNKGDILSAAVNAYHVMASRIVCEASKTPNELKGRADGPRR